MQACGVIALPYGLGLEFSMKENDQQKLARYFYKGHNHKNCVTRASGVKPLFLICIFSEVFMKKSVYWWLSLFVAGVTGWFLGFYIKEWPQFLFAVFLFVVYGALCSIDTYFSFKD